MATSPTISVRESIATKLLKKVFLVYILFAVTITALHMYLEYRRVKNDISIEINTLYATVNKPLAIAIWDADNEQIGSLLDGLVGSNIIFGVLITETDGRHIRSIGRVVDGQKGRNIKDKFSLRRESIGDQPDLFGYQYPISHSEEAVPNLLGHITLFTSKTIILNKIKHQFFYIVVTECIKACILLLVFLWYGKRLLTGPLSGLAARASKITMDNLQPIHFDYPAKTRNEVTVLRDAFNKMIHNLLKGVQKQKELYAKLNSYKNNLQSLVNTQTKELRKTNRDLTDQIKVRKDAEGKVSQYGKILENSLNEIYVFNPKNLTFLTVNEGARKNLGYSASELEKLTAVDIIPVYSKKTFETLLSPLRTGEEEMLIIETIHKRKDASTYNVEMHLQLMKFPEMEVFVAINLDISEKLILEEQLRQSQKMKAIGTLAGGIAHDFNNLLMGVQGRASLVTTTLKPSDPNFAHITEIEAYVKKAEHLTHQLLGIARGGKYDPQPIRVYDLVMESLTMFGRTKKEITITSESNNKDVVVEVDRHQIEQVLLNIFLNAWQSMSSDGTIHLKTGTVSLDSHLIKHYNKPAEPHAMIAISDNGSGMDESTLNQIFNPFFTTKDRERGTGLGLASAYGIIKNHHGFITVDSKIGHGSTFTIYLPISDQPAKQEATSADIAPVKGKGVILLVDDEQMILHVANAMLTELGYQIFTAESGKQALEMMKSHDTAFDLVILDLIMPKMNGTETFHQIKSINPQQAILLSSGYSIDGQTTELLNKGCSGFIQKPFGMSELSHAIKETLDGKATG